MGAEPPAAAAVPPPPAEPGIPLGGIETPALLVDLGAFNRNLRGMAREAGAAGLALRPHAKTHKCAEIARRQMVLGAVGVCCQKASEAAALVGAGVGDVLVSNEVVGTRKLERLADLARGARVGVCVDDPGNAAEVAAAARRAGAVVDVLVEIDVGAGRCGVPPGSAAVDLARAVDAADGVRFAGLQAYQGRAQHIRDHAGRSGAVAEAVSGVRETVRLLGEAGLPCGTVTGAGTGTWRLEAASGAYTELQPGSYVFMDADYAGNRDERGGPWNEFEHALHVCATVMSRSGDRRAVLDAGLKAVSTDSGPPLVPDLEGARITGMSDEHAVVEFPGPAPAPPLGAKVRLVPGHCDPTVNLHDWYVVVGEGRVEALWRIEARGCIW